MMGNAAGADCYAEGNMTASSSTQQSINLEKHMPSRVELSITAITIDPVLQPRVDGIDPDYVRALEDVLDAVPPIRVVEWDGQKILVDGFQRVAAFQNRGVTTVPVEMVPAPADGDLKALAFTLNAGHGRPFSQADRRAEGTRLLRRHPDWADREIGRRCGLAQPTVAKLRDELEASAQIEQTDVRLGRGGYTYTVGTNAKQRPAGELPDEGLGERVSGAVGRMFTSEERRQQRRLASYFKRLAVALEDGGDLAGWESATDAAEACRLVLGDEDAADLGERLGRTSRNVLDVAIALGYDDDEDRA